MAAATVTMGTGGLDALAARTQELLRPPPDLTLSEWADRYYQMSPEDGGKWRTLPYQRGVMDAFTDPELERVTVVKSARVGYTKMLTALLLRNMHLDPCSQMVVQPTVEDAEGFSKSEVAPAIERHEFLRGRVADAKSRISANTILAKTYLGCTLWFVGANSGRGFRRIHVRDAIGDECDAWVASAGDDGDQIELMWRRSQEAKIGRKLINGSTPLVKGASRIDRLFEQSDQRHFYVPCPHCDEWQPLEWGGKDKDFGFKFETASPKRARETVQYLCRRCHTLIDEREKPRMLALAEREGWKAHKPENAGHAGFYLWSAYSLSPNATWGDIAHEFVRLRDDPLGEKTFTNTWLGQASEERGRAPNEDKLMARREVYPVRDVGAAEPQRMVPRGAKVLTAFCDVQMDRLEVGVEAWGLGEENWKLEYQVLYGDPTAAPVWAALLEYLLRPRFSELGPDLFIRSAGVDSGYASQSVYAFVRERPVFQTANGRTSFLWATKGKEGKGPVWPAKPNHNSIAKCPLYTVQVDTAKDAIAARLEVEAPGPGYVHFPLFFEGPYFKQLTSEHCVDSRNKKGFPVRAWKMKPGHHRNEALDVAVGNYAMLCALQSVGFTIESESLYLDSLVKPPEPAQVASEEAQIRSGRAGRGQGGGSWLGDTSGWL
jgi:phage terminase large subunit GpA-like protein